MNKLLLTLILIVVLSCNEDKKRVTAIEFKSNIINFSEISINDTIEKSIFIKNIGKNELIIDTIGVSCGCTLVDYDRRPILTNKNAEIKIRYVSKEVGSINKSIVVETNTDPPFNVFYLKGEVK